MITRWEGYKKYYSNKNSAIGELDFASNATILLAEDKNKNTVGTIRILDRKFGNIELDSFIDIDAALSENEKPCAEATRLVVVKQDNSLLIKLLLFKAYYIYCMLNQINTMIISARSKFAHDYEYMRFKDVGPAGIYLHKSLGNNKHRTFKFDAQGAEEMWRKMNHPLFTFFIDQYHPAINIAGLKK